MGNNITKIISVALIVVMALSALGCVMVGAEGYDEYTRTIYFFNCKDWDEVYAYIWSDSGESEMTFPGIKLEKVGTTDMIDRTIYADEQFDVYALDLKSGDDYVIFSEGFEHGQQSSTVITKYPWGGINFVSLDLNNVAMVGHFLHPDRIRFD